MSGPEDTPEDGVQRDDPMIAAEWALGLLEGEELLAARGKYATDPDFAWRKEWWDDWFAPLSDAMPGAEPGEHVWNGIAARVTAAQQAADAPVGDVAAGSNVVALEARVRLWQRVAGLSSIAAAALLAWVALAPSQFVDTPQPAELLAVTEPMVAIVPIGEDGLRLDVTYIPGSERMVVSAIGLTADGVHDHELWLTPKYDGPLQSLGVVKPGEVRSMVLPAAVTAKLGRGAGLVLTREPIGGKPEGKEAGPVVASGAFKEV
jgi:anti-sigma-K factor RskA